MKQTTEYNDYASLHAVHMISIVCASAVLVVPVVTGHKPTIARATIELQSNQLARRLGALTCIMKSVMGLEALYAFGKTCSSIPPCGVAIFVLEADADVDAAVIVVVRIEVTVAVAILRRPWEGQCRTRREA